MSSVYKDKKLGLYNKHGMVDRPDSESEMIGEIQKGRLMLTRQWIIVHYPT